MHLWLNEKIYIIFTKRFQVARARCESTTCNAEVRDH